MANTKAKKTNENSNIATFNKRINIVYSMLLAGLRRYDIFQECKKLEWGVSERQIDNYIAEGKKIIESESKENRAYEFSKSLSRYENLYTKALKVQDLKTAVTIIDKRNRMLGIAETSENSFNDNEITINHTIVTRTETTNPEMDFTDDGD